MLNFQEPCWDVQALVLDMPVPILSLMGDGSTALASLLLKPTCLSRWMRGGSVKSEQSHPGSWCGDRHPSFLLAAEDQTGWGEIERWSMRCGEEMLCWTYTSSSTFPYHHFSGCIQRNEWWKLLFQPQNEILSLYRIKFNSSAFCNTCSLRTYFAYFE